MPTKEISQQAPRCWNQDLKHFMIEAGFVHSTTSDLVNICIVYIDDLILITCSGSHVRNKRAFQDESASLLLGVNFVYGQNCAWLYQQQYIS